MDAERRLRILTLIGLAVLGIGLAVAGTAFGSDNPLAGTDNTEFNIADENVTLSDSDREILLIDDLSEVESVEITEDDGQFTVHSTDGEGSSPAKLTDDERERAVEIARDNETVRQHLEGLAEYELTAERSAVATADEAQEFTAEETQERDANGSESFEFSAETASVDDGGDSVTVSRERAADDTVTVPVRDLEEDAVRFIAEVDLAEETVVSTTDG